jgi:hypothetical protein
VAGAAATGGERVIDRLIFGDNQFFGVNHLSEEKARAQLLRFQDLDAIIEVLDAAYDEGIRSWTCTTHDRVEQICDHIRANPERYQGFKLLPGMPYAHKYANAVTEDGMMGAIRRFLPNGGLLDAMVRGTSSVARQDIAGVLTLLIDAEMKMFHGLETPVIFLQNVVTDLALGMGAYDAFRVFADHIKANYDAEPAFMSMNLPLMLDALEKAGVENPIVCCNINKLGFRMSGGFEEYRRALTERDARVIAMSVFASGGIEPREALEWVYEQPNIEAVVFGASSRGNIRSTVSIVNELSNR